MSPQVQSTVSLTVIKGGALFSWASLLSKKHMGAYTNL